MMNAILIPFEDESERAQLELGLLAARIFSSHVDGLSHRPIVDAALYGDGFPAAVEEWDRREDARIARAEKAFRTLMASRDVVWGEPEAPGKAVSADWISGIDRGVGAVGQLARLYDMTVLPQLTSRDSSDRYELFETILFESGRPVLIAPGAEQEKLGETVVIAWNGSTESARVIAFARPFLLRAAEAHVLSVEDGMVPGPTAEQVQTSLKRAGIASQAHVVGQHGRSTGEAILEETAKLGADLLIKGAYTHSRLRQLIFGGATSHILKEATLPVLMAH